MKTKKTIDFSNMTYQEMADVVRAVRSEVKHRNSIGVNFYTQVLDAAVAALEEISQGEVGNFTSEHGPRERRRKEVRV